MQARPARALLLAPVGVVACVAIVLGFGARDESHIVAESGLGYWLGPVGLGMMVLLLLYSPRKRWSALRNAGPIQSWFHVHMMLGILGPTAILFHANFHLGSLNANAAFISMLVVAGSGVVGRFIYTRIHYEYRGHVLTFAELRREAEEESGTLTAAEAIAPEMARVLRSYEESATSQRGGWGRISSFLTLGRRSRAARRQAMAAYRKALRGAGARGASERTVAKALRQHVQAVRRVGAFAVYERAFALWHALHLPFCFVLFAAAAVHVVAVHMY